MIKIEQKGDFSNTLKFLKKVKKPFYKNILNKYGKKGVKELSSKTPVKTGLTASSWKYKIVEEENNNLSLIFYNSNVVNHVNIAVILDTGHATKNGGWVQGLHYIDKALRPVFEKMPDEIWKEVLNNG